MKCKNCNYDVEQQILFLYDENDEDHTDYPEPNKYDVCENCCIIGRYSDSLDLIPLTSDEFETLKIIDYEKFQSLLGSSMLSNEFRFINTKVDAFNICKELLKNYNNNLSN